jgi:hypothetical protein
MIESMRFQREKKRNDSHTLAGGIIRDSAPAIDEVETMELVRWLFNCLMLQRMELLMAVIHDANSSADVACGEQHEMKLKKTTSTNTLWCINEHSHLVDLAPT